MQPLVPIEVDEETGVWTTDGLPMLYVPRHFFTNNHLAVEDALGQQKYAEILYDAGYKSAYFWCEKEAEKHQLTGMAVFDHYLKRLSQRGWGLFSFESVDPITGSAEIKLEYSSFVLAQPDKPGKLCYMFAGWFAGAMDWVTQEKGHSAHTNCGEVSCAETYCTESQCGASGNSYCIFSVTPLAKKT